MDRLYTNSGASNTSQSMQSTVPPCTKATLADVFKHVRVKSTGNDVNMMKKSAPSVKETVPKGSTFKMSTKTANAQRTGTTVGQSKAAQSSAKKEKEDIEIYHEKKIRYFESLQQQLPEKKRQWENCSDVHRKKQLEREIQSIENREEETNYFLQVYEILAEYKDANARKESSNSQEEQLKLLSLNDIISKRDTSYQQSLTNEYYRTVDPKKLCPNSLSIGLQQCDDVDCSGILTLSNGAHVCMQCGTPSSNAGSHFAHTFKDIQDIQYKSTFAYKRITRFCDLLNSWQAKEHMEVPEAVIDAVRSEIEKDGLRSHASLEYKKVRYYLKRTNNCKYYEHWAYIVARITGEPPLKISSETEEELIRMFKKIQEPFEEAREEVQPTRTSFLSYTYVCYKFFELLGMYDKLKFFNLLKSREKLDIQDKIWRSICTRLDWPFYRSKT